MIQMGQHGLGGFLGVSFLERRDNCSMVVEGLPAHVRVITRPLTAGNIEIVDRAHEQDQDLVSSCLRDLGMQIQIDP